MSDAGTRESVAVSQWAKIENIGSDHLVLDSGHMEQNDKTSGEHTHVEFKNYRVHAGTSSGPYNSTPRRARSTPPTCTRAAARLHGRAHVARGPGLGATNLLFMGISLSAANPRRASNWGLLFAALAFVIYYNLLNLTQAWVGSGKVNIVVVLVGLHGRAFLLGLGLPGGASTPA